MTILVATEDFQKMVHPLEEFIGNSVSFYGFGRAFSYLRLINEEKKNSVNRFSIKDATEFDGDLLYAKECGISMINDEGKSQSSRTEFLKRFERIAEMKI